MLRATVRGVLARKFRLALTSLAVVLGVSFVSTTYVLTDTLDKSFRSVFDQTLSGVDVVLRSRPLPGDDDHERFSDSVLGRVRSVDAVASAGGFVEGYAQFVGKDGDAIGGDATPSFGVAWIGGRERGPLRLVDVDGRRSRAPRAADEVAMDVETARENGFRPGDRVEVLSAGPKEQFDLVGVFALGDSGAVGPVSFAAFPLRTAQRLMGAQGFVNAIYVRGADGVPVGALRRQLADELGPTFDVARASEVAADSSADISEFLDLLTGVLLGFAAIGLVVAAFIIFNTFTILVAQRTHELGLLRAMGASRRQIIGSVVVEAAIVGGLASFVGLVVGVLFARVLFSLVGAIGFDVPEGDLVLQSRTVVAALAVGMFVTVGASIWPAVRASTVPPVAAINDVPAARVGSFRRRVLLGGTLVVVGAPILVVGVLRADSAADVLAALRVVGVGALLVFFGVIVLLATFARPLAAALGVPVRAAGGVTGAIARGNAMRNPRRTAATASALVIGLALVEMVAIFERRSSSTPSSSRGSRPTSSAVSPHCRRSERRRVSVSARCGRSEARTTSGSWA